MENNGRRKFLGLCLGGLAAGATAAVAYPVYRYLAPRGADATAGTVTIPEKELPPGEAKFLEFAGSAAVVVRTKNGDLIALSAVCTHLGCIVQWEKDKQGFVCPCHAGYYTANGDVISGPPPRPLKKLPVRIADGVITVG
ncbi:QcrA and Rieske domain-containing protein [Trichlorobacter ammonificans]|uniref:Ubiquinol-cytochrome C reductase iron-sulfur subunit n=1 Tax=Trichlorobacter ammonificans TaxID=2916410 RepID=A0ABM9D766_9BACT|nr:Rieske 2Fe-2S domain-containing protein [Trichlorobacter ammonificans]CAH2031048.1 Ubiquinol-cytochrome C reductase iron-sulfur subunit [Trichlorobacter ammonificans]